MRFMVLGPLQIVVDGEPRPSLGKTAALLAALLLDRNRPVSVERLIETVWPDDTPRTPQRQLQNRVAEIRSLIGGDPGCALETIGQAYQLRVGPGGIDVDRFESGRAYARSLVEDGDPVEALAVYDRALGLWRGPAFAGLSGRLIETGAAVLEESRMEVVEERLDLLLHLRRFDLAAAEARGLLADHPFRERLVCQLMKGLAATGRTAEALEAYETLRRALAETLGIDPGSQVRQVHLDILRGNLDPHGPTGGPSSRSRPRVPHQLPAPVPGFVGRTAELARIDARWARRDGKGPLAIAITGIGGAGKTALGLEWARRRGDDFPDGQLHADLRGGETGAAQPLTVLHGFLRALGARPTDLPGDLGQAAANYRALLAGRRVLVFLDNARDADQVRPLLPGAGGSAVVVTGRGRLDRLRHISDAVAVELAELPEADAVALLRGLTGDAAAKDADAAAVAAHCGGLPLALRIAAGLLDDRPSLGLAGLAKHLGDGRLWQAGERDQIARVFDLSHAELDEDERRCLRDLALLPVPDIGERTALRLASASGADGERVLSGLVSAYLVRAGTDGRYRLHRLVAEYARAKEPATADEQRALRERTVAEFRDLRAPAPLEDYGFLTAAYRAWAAHPEGAALADVLCAFAKRGHRPEELETLGEAALAAAGPDPVRLARHRNLVAVAAYARGALAKAEEYGRGALEAMERTEHGDRFGSARANLATALARLGREQEALPLLAAALDAALAAGRGGDAAVMGMTLGWLHYRMRDFAAAEAALDLALTRFERGGDAAMAREVHAHLAEVYRAWGRHTSSRASLRRMAGS
jgi:DNA-binding SARP family transcriptional activator/tetratricopeptide (TPR) repeat protein